MDELNAHSFFWALNYKFKLEINGKWVNACNIYPSYELAESQSDYLCRVYGKSNYKKVSIMAARFYDNSLNRVESVNG